RQSTQRGSCRDRRGGRRRLRRRGGARPAGGNRAGDRVGGGGRRGRHRGQGTRAGPGVRRPHDPVRRPGGGAGGAPKSEDACMIPLPISLLAGLGQVHAREDQFTGVQVDSRRLAPGDLFVAVGRGSEFLDDALSRGAAATLVPDDAFAVLGRIAREVRDRSNARVVGITGSMGKTSTKDILAALCAPAARTIAAEASFNNEIGVPLTLCPLEAATEV